MTASVARYFVSDGDLGVDQAVAHMVELIRSGVATPLVRRVVTDLVGALPSAAIADQVYAIRDFLDRHVVFLRDPSGTELLHSPEWMLRAIAERGAAYVDCDDVAILAATLCGAIGLRVSLVTVAFLDKSAPLSHIYAAATAPEDWTDAEGEQVWIELDVTRPMQVVPTDVISRTKVYPVFA